MTLSRTAALVLATLSLPLLLGASGCGPVSRDGGAEDSEEQGQGQQPGKEEEEQEEQPQPSQPSCGSELHILGVYETHSDHSYNNHPPGAAAVHVERQGAMVLALSSYEPVHWTVTAEPGAVIEKVIINGYYDQSADVPPGVPVEIYAGPAGSFGTYAYAWPAAEGGSDPPGLVSAIEQAVGLQMTSFHGCYQSTSFVLHDDLDVTAACAEDSGYYLTGHVEDSCGPVDPGDGRRLRRALWQ